MTNQEIIQALKENTLAFGLMPIELQEKAEQIGPKNFQCFNDDGMWHVGGDSKFHPMTTYQLCFDYTEEPERIELSIYKHDGSLWVRNAPGLTAIGVWHYTTAPALCPKEGYRFCGYRYKDWDGLRPEPIQYSYTGVRVDRFEEGKTEVVFPVAAVYQKEAKC